MLRRFLVPLLILSSPLLCPAQGADLELGAVLQEARQASLNLEAVAARVDAARADLETAEDSRWPRFDVVARAMASDDPAAVFAMELQQGRFSLEEFAQAEPGEADFTDDWSLGLELSMPLWTGGRIALQRRGAALGIESAELGGLGTELEIDRRALEAWLGVARAQAMADSLGARHDSLKGLRQRLTDLHRQGLALQADRLEVEAHLAALEAGQAEARAHESGARAMLGALLGRVVDEAIELPVESPLRLPSDDILRERLDRRPDLLAADLAMRHQDIEIAAARAARLPMVGLMAGVSSHDHRVFGGNLDQTNAVVAVEGRWRVPDRRERAGLRASEFLREAASLELESTRRQALAELQSAQASLEAALASQLAAQAGRVAAAEHLRVRRERFDAGLVTPTDVLDAEALLAEAEGRSVEARAGRLLAEARLALSAGIPLLEIIPSGVQR